MNTNIRTKASAALAGLALLATGIAVSTNTAEAATYPHTEPSTVRPTINPKADAPRPTVNPKASEPRPTINPKAVVRPTVNPKRP